jgi:hypothetical protein
VPDGTVSASKISSVAPDAFAAASSGARFASGCGISASGRPGSPSAAAVVCAEPPNSSVQSVTVGFPSRSIRTESWTLHDVDVPQCPTPLMMASHPAKTSSA